MLVVKSKVNRFIKIQYTVKGKPFIKKDNKRLYLDNFLRIDYIFYDIDVKINGTILKTEDFDGIMSLSFYIGYLIKLNDNGEAAKVYYFKEVSKED
jgi:hypothetical protein